MEIEGRSAEELCQEAFEHLQQGRLAAAAERLERVLAARPDYFDALHYLGIAYGYMGRLDEAEEHLRKAVEVFPGSAPAHYNLGLILHYRGKHEEAMREFRSSLELNPYYEPVQEVLAELGEPMEQMVRDILEAQAAAKEERKTFAEKFAEAPWAALREKETELVAPPPIKEERPPERPLSNLSARMVATILDTVILGILTFALGLSIAGILRAKGLPLPPPAEGERPPLTIVPEEVTPPGHRPLAPEGLCPFPICPSPKEMEKALENLMKQPPQEAQKILQKELEKIPTMQRLLPFLPNLVLSFLYFGLMWALLAKTLGMMILGLELVDTSYAKPAAWRGIVRWIVFNLPTLIAVGIIVVKPALLILRPSVFLLIAAFGLLLLLLNLFLVAATPKKQAVHDLAAGTLVVGRTLPAWVGILVVVVLFGLIVVLPFAL